jgi:hypothetical protein
VVWATKYRYKVLQGAMRDQIPIAIAGMWRDADFRQGNRVQGGACRERRAMT